MTTYARQRLDAALKDTGVDFAFAFECCRPRC